MRIALFFITLLGVGIVSHASCTNEEGARRALESAGYDEIVLHGHAWSGCADGDDTCTSFEAVGPRGRHIDGVVGCGYSAGCRKGCTIRTF